MPRLAVTLRMTSGLRDIPRALDDAGKAIGRQTPGGCVAAFKLLKNVRTKIAGIYAVATMKRITKGEEFDPEGAALVHFSLRRLNALDTAFINVCLRRGRRVAVHGLGADAGGGLPRGWKRKRLGDLLPAEALAEIERSYNAGTLTMQRLKDICHRYAAAIDAQGNDPTFIAYAVAQAIGIEP